jgi:hypothetical protein
VAVVTTRHDATRMTCRWWSCVPGDGGSPPARPCSSLDLRDEVRRPWSSASAPWAPRLQLCRRLRVGTSGSPPSGLPPPLPPDRGLGRGRRGGGDWICAAVEESDRERRRWPQAPPPCLIQSSRSMRAP